MTYISYFNTVHLYTEHFLGEMTRKMLYNAVTTRMRNKHRHAIMNRIKPFNKVHLKKAK